MSKYSIEREQRFMDLYTSICPAPHSSIPSPYSIEGPLETVLERALETYRVLSYCTSDYVFGLDENEFHQFMKLYPGRSYAFGVLVGKSAHVRPQGNGVSDFHSHVTANAKHLQWRVWTQPQTDPADVVLGFMQCQARATSRDGDLQQDEQLAFIAFGVDVWDIDDRVTKEIRESCEVNSWQSFL